jgi:type III secretory pathway component EscS
MGYIVGLIIGLILIISGIYHDSFHLAIKIFLIYTVITFFVITSFARIYANSILKFSETNNTQYSVDLPIEGLEYEVIDEKKLYNDMVYFSSMTYFTIGYGDIHLKGDLKYLTIIEAFIGYGVLGVLIAVSISISTNQSKEYNILMARLTNKYMLASINHFFLGLYEVVLVSKSGKVIVNSMNLKRSEYAYLKELEIDFSEIENYNININSELILLTLKNKIGRGIISKNKNYKLLRSIKIMLQNKQFVTFDEIILELYNHKLYIQNKEVEEFIVFIDNLIYNT